MKKLTKTQKVIEALKKLEGGDIIKPAKFAEENDLSLTILYGITGPAAKHGALTKAGSKNEGYMVDSNAMQIYLHRLSSDNCTAGKAPIKRKMKSKSVIALDTLIDQLQAARLTILKAEKMLSLIGD